MPRTPSLFASIETPTVDDISRLETSKILGSGSPETGCEMTDSRRRLSGSHLAKKAAGGNKLRRSLATMLVFASCCIIGAGVALVYGGLHAGRTGQIAVPEPSQDEYLGNTTQGFFTEGAKLPASGIPCVSWTPFHTTGYDIQSIDDDFRVLTAAGFSCVKTYQSQHYHGAIKIADRTKAQSLLSVIGVWLHEDDKEFEIEVQAAIEACQEPTVISLWVGLEQPERADEISFVVDKLRTSGCKKPIGTAQMLEDYLNGKMPQWLNEKLDFVGATVYPYFSGNADLQNPSQDFVNQVTSFKIAFPSLWSKFRLMETGWPTEGGAVGQNPASFQLAERYFMQVAKVLCNSQMSFQFSSYFMAHDDDTKGPPLFEKFFGIFTADNKPKWDMTPLTKCASSPTPTTSPPLTSPPSAAPSTIFPPSADSFAPPTTPLPSSPTPATSTTAKPTASLVTPAPTVGGSANVSTDGNSSSSANVNPNSTGKGAGGVIGEGSSKGEEEQKGSTSEDGNREGSGAVSAPTPGFGGGEENNLGEVQSPQSGEIMTGPSSSVAPKSTHLAARFPFILLLLCWASLALLLPGPVAL